MSWPFTASSTTSSGPSVELAGVPDDGHRHPHLVVGGADQQAVGRDGVPVGASRHEHDVVAVLRPAGHPTSPADGPCTHHDEPHRASLPRRGPALRGWHSVASSASHGPLTMLDERKAAILRAVVEEYIDTAQPVGSAHVVKSSGVQVSSATVRNDMATLEQEGYLRQPHTSAGRIPTEKGYRFFVDNLGAPGRAPGLRRRAGALVLRARPR